MYVITTLHLADLYHWSIIIFQHKVQTNEGQSGLQAGCPEKQNV
jgi:hypothetical protein